jgi:hypothetical protein
MSKKDDCNRLIVSSLDLLYELERAEWLLEPFIRTDYYDGKEQEAEKMRYFLDIYLENARKIQLEIKENIEMVNKMSL